MRQIKIPHDALVLLIGPPGSGKSTFAAKNFRATEIVSSDECRALVSDNMEDMACSALAFDVFHHIIDARLQLGRLTVADATSLTDKARLKLREIATKHGAPTVVFALISPLDVCQKQNKERTRYVPESVIETHYEKLAGLVDNSVLLNEGYGNVYYIYPRVNPVEVVVQNEQPPITASGYDVIGDVHGCYDELIALIRKLGYVIDKGPEGTKLIHPDGRKLVFVGDFTDRGPKNRYVLEALRSLLLDGHLAVQGNHDNKLWRWLKGNKVSVAHGLERTIRELNELPAEARKEYLDILSGLPYYLKLEVPGHPDLVVCHAGMPRDMVGRSPTGPVKSHCLYGETSNQQDEHGFPLRGSEYIKSWPRGEDQPMLVHGHIVVKGPFADLRAGHNVVNVDNGCVFGDQLTAFRYPECLAISVPAKEDYSAAWTLQLAIEKSYPKEV